MKYLLDNDLCDREHMLAHTSFPFLVNANTGEVLGEMHDTVDKETGEPKQVQKPRMCGTAQRVRLCYMIRRARSLRSRAPSRWTVCNISPSMTCSSSRWPTDTLDWAEGVTGVPADTIAQVAREYAKSSIICNGVGGIDKFSNNDIAGHCYALIASLTGNYGKRGTGCGIYHYHTVLSEAKLGALEAAGEQKAHA